jgi:hypothetical protein
LFLPGGCAARASGSKAALLLVEFSFAAVEILEEPVYRFQH